MKKKKIINAQTKKTTNTFESKREKKGKWVLNIYWKITGRYHKLVGLQIRSGCKWLGTAVSDLHTDDCDTSWFRRTVRDARCIVGYKHSADTGQRAAQRNENSASETFNINLLWCEFMWVRGKVRFRGAGRLTTASQGCGECERSGEAAERTAGSNYHCFCSSWAFLHPKAQPLTRALVPEGNFHPAWSMWQSCLHCQPLFLWFYCSLRVAVGEGNPTAMPCVPASASCVA